MLHAIRKGGFDPIFERVETPESMKEALARQEWDIIISDDLLPALSSGAALSILAETGIDLPLIVVSGSTRPNAAGTAIEAGARDFVPKDNISQLVPAIERQLYKKQMRRQRIEAD